MTAFDNVTEATRKAMRANKGKDTKPELVVRRALYAMGYRYRLHRRDLPGRPDIAFIGRRKAIFVHGCFWHAHEGCARSNMPKTRSEFWTAKFARNTARDERDRLALNAMGWQTMTVWECETSDVETLGQTLSQFVIG